MIYVIAIFGLILRLVTLNQSLWLDEATTALVAKMSLGDIFSRFLPGDFHPPLYYLVLKFWTDIFGLSEISLRIPSVVFGISTIYVIYLIGGELFNKKTGLIASFLLATSGLHIYYSQEARMYALAALLISLLIYFFIKKKWVVFSLTLVLVGMTDYVSLFILPIFLVLAGRDIKRVVLSFIPTMLSYLLWFPTFLQQLSGGTLVAGSSWGSILGTPTFKNIVLIPTKFIIGRIGLDDKTLYGLLMVVIFILFGYLLSKSVKSTTKILWMWLLLPIAIGIVISFKIPTLSYFRFLFCLPSFYLLVSYGLTMIKPNHQKVFFILVLLINLISTLVYLFNPRFQREEWREVSKKVGNVSLVFPAKSQREAIIYYGKDNQIVEIENLGKDKKEIWLSRYVWEIFDPSDLTRKRVEELGYNKTSEYNFNGVVFWRYQR